MEIYFNGKYKSLNSFTSERLKIFSVITGKNGSGKTQLLQLLRSANDHTSHPFSLILNPQPETIQYEGIAFGKVEALTGLKISQQLTQTFSKISSISEPIKGFILELLSNGLDPNKIADTLDVIPYMNEMSEKEKNDRLFDISRRFFGGMEYASTAEEQLKKTKKKLAEKILDLKRAIISTLEVAHYKKISFSDVTKNDFYSTPLSETDYTNDSSFAVQIENLLYGYARKRFINEMEYNRKISYQSPNNSIDPKEFDKLNIPPWIRINQIFSKHNFKLRIMEIKPEEFSPEYDLDFHLLNVETNEKIKIDELSSGEKIIVGLIIRLFLTETYKQHLKFPDCILFDEPDAFLHPEVSSLLVDVLYQTFSKEFGIQVIITTHNPSTIAISPDDCIYELTNGINTSLKNISKDSALMLLTENLPLLSINYGNHRQIFVESPTDQYYYQTIFNKLKADKKTLFDLYFITAGYGKSNCGEVIKLTNELRKAGNKTCYGIIDWDNTNSFSEYIIVNGFEKRYSIENFILDPIHLSILFIEQNCGNNIGVLGFDTSYNQYSLPNESEERLQSVCEWFFKKIELEFPAFKYENLISIEYGNSKKLNIPGWYLITKGHDIEVKLKTVFPSLAAFRNEGDLQKRLTDIASKCYPFLPVESINTLVNLSKNKK